MLKKTVTFSFLFFLYFNAIGQTTWEIFGKIHGESSPLSFATVYATKVENDTDQKILSFTTTKDDGSFELKIDTSIHEVILVCNYLGYQKKQIPVSLKTSFPLKITMQLQDNDLQEVIITERQLPINTRGDTIVYNFSEFRDSTEKTVEDVLKKLPGIEVEENGQISVGGKPIKKLMIEGTDMFGRKYTIGSQNIRADFIKSVEVIDHYQENHVVKDIVSSEDIVLNLKLKEKVKNILSGVLNFGTGYGDELKLTSDANIFLISKTRKILFISNNGNTGNQYGVEELGATFFDQGYSDWSDPIQSLPTFSEPMRTNHLNFKKAFLDNSKSSFNTFRNFYDLGETVKMKINGTYASQKDAQKSIEKTSYIFQEELFENNFEQNQQLKNQLAQIDLKLNYLHPKASQSFDFYASYEFGQHKAFQENHELSNSFDNFLRDDLDAKKNIFFVAGLYTFKLNDKSAIFLGTKNSLSRQPDFWKGNNSDFNLVLPFATTFKHISQDIFLKNRLHEFSVSYVKKLNKWMLKAQSTVLTSRFSFSKSWASFNENSSEELENISENTEIKKDFSWENTLTISKTFGGSARLNFKVSTFYRTAEVENQKIDFFAKDNFSILLWGNQRFKNHTKLFFSYSFQNQNFPNYNLISSNFITSNFGLQNYFIPNQLSGGHRLSLRLSQNNTHQLTNYLLGINYGFAQKGWLNDFVFYNSIVSTTPVFSTNNNYFRVYGKVEQFIPKTKTNVELKPSVIHRQTEQIVDGNISKTHSTNLNIHLRLAWRANQNILLTLENTLGRRYFNQKKEQIKTKFNDWKIHPFLSYQFKGWKTKTSIYYFKSAGPNQNVSLLGNKFRLEKKLKLKSWEPTFTLEFNNLFNKKWYSTILNSDSFTFVNQVEAIPPFFIFSLDYTF